MLNYETRLKCGHFLLSGSYRKSCSIPQHTQPSSLLSSSGRTLYSQLWEIPFTGKIEMTKSDKCRLSSRSDNPEMSAWIWQHVYETVEPVHEHSSTTICGMESGNGHRSNPCSVCT